MEETAPELDADNISQKENIPPKEYIPQKENIPHNIPLSIERMHASDVASAQAGGRQSETGRLVENYVTFCRNAAIDAKDPKSLVKMIMACMKSVDKRQVYDALFPGNPYLHWDYIDSISQAGAQAVSHSEPDTVSSSVSSTSSVNVNAFGGIGCCIAMVGFIDFPDVEVAFKASSGERAYARTLAVHKVFVDELHRAGLHVPLQMALRMVLLYNLSNISGSVVLEQYSGQCLRCATREGVLKLIASFADQRFTVDDYTEGIAWLLGRTRVSQAFENEVLQHFSQRESMHNVFRLKYAEASVGRPRLQDRLRKVRETTSVSLGNGGSVLSGGSMDTFDGWCTRVRFPNTASSSLKHKLYVVMSQPHVNHTDVVIQFTNAQLAKAVVSQPVVRPDDAVLSRVIEQLDIRSAPFPELTTFIRSCFRAFPQKNLADMTILKYMQLYLAAYQHRDLWKNCWTNIYPLLSYQVIRDVEDFVRNTPFNQQAFIQILRNE